MLFLEAPPSLVVGVTFSADSNLLAAGLASLPETTTGSGARVWDAGGSLVDSFDSPSPGFRTVVAIQPNSGSVAISAETKVYIQPFNKRETVLVFSHRTPGESTDLTFLSPELLVVGTGKRAGPSAGGYYLYDVAKKMIRQPVQSEPHGVRSLAVHPQSKTIAWVTGNNLLRWATITKPGHNEFRLGHPASSVAFSPNGTALAAAVDWKVRTFDLASRTERSTLTGHKGQVTGVAYSPDGRAIASGSWDETVRLWEVSSGAELACFDWKIGKVLSLAYSPDGTRLAAGSDRGLIAVWDVG